MEVVGRNAAHQMQTWIREEFAYITHKRDLEISDSEEESRIRQELQIHEFNGGNSKDWILQLEDFFEFFQLNEEAKLKVSIIGLNGDARRWFEDEHRRRPFYDWQELKGQMLRHFGSTSTLSWQVQSDSMQWNDKEKRLSSSLGYSNGGEAEFPGDCTSDSHSVVVAQELQEDPGIEEEDEKCENSDLKKFGVAHQIVGPRKGATCGGSEDGFQEVADGYTGEGRRGHLGKESGDKVFMGGGINPHQGVDLQHDAVKRRRGVQQGPVAGYCGLLLGSPVILYEIIAFVLPGLTRAERRFLGPIVLGSSVLFYAGLTFSYFVLTPAALNFFVTYAEGAVESIWSIDQYFEFVLVLMFSTGISFQVPVIQLLLGQTGLVSGDKMLSVWRYVVVGAVVVAAVATPSTDPLTQMLLAGPLLGLYLGGAWMVKLTGG
ncbi:hypothetical protein BVRB_4g092900 [Beta vulgaris subsp. vulgaris]|nr:hypothetical protein BVRB_4g092900 [Beta vulgaris subsp. vulgaris]